MFRTVPLPIIRSLFTAYSALVYVIQVCRQLSSRSIWSCSKAVYKPVWHIPVPSMQWINSWCWAEELSETCRVPCQNKFEKLVHLVGFIIKTNKSVLLKIMAQMITFSKLKPYIKLKFHSWIWKFNFTYTCHISHWNWVILLFHKVLNF